MSQFTEIQYSKAFFNSILFNIFNNNEKLNKFLELINYDYISISGSSILQTIKEKNYDNSDLDIYIEVDKMNIQDMIKLIKFLHKDFNVSVSEPYNSYNYSRNIKQLQTAFNNYVNDTYSVSNDTYSVSNDTYSVSNDTYSSLRNYLLSLITFNSSNKKIELIFISNNIETILLNTFDYDIVRNYWKQEKIFCHNLIAIKENIATMELSHFINRICLGSYNETENFIKRYMKYHARGFKFFIHKTYVSKDIFIYIANIFRNINHIYYDLTDDDNTTKFNIMLNRNYYCLYINTSTMPKLKTKNLILEKRSHVVKYLLLAGIYQNYKLRKNILKYSDYLLDEYLMPDSPYIIYKLNKWHKKDIYNINDEKDNKDKKICYISNNNLKQLVLNK